MAKFRQRLTEIASAREAALQYLEYGWQVVPIALGKKCPHVKEWQHLRVTPETLDKYFDHEPQNVGVLLGEPSGGLVDVDLDHPIAREFADQFLPATPAVFGRVGNPRSHRIYVTSSPVESIRLKTCSKKCIVELRSTGAQTVFPPSTHPTGEKVEWADGASMPAIVNPQCLVEAVHKIAQAVRAALGEHSHREPSIVRAMPAVAAIPVSEVELARSALAAVSAIRAADRDDWLRIGMALHSISPDLLPDWIDFSKRCPDKFQAGECERLWGSFRRDGGVSGGSLFFIAARDGWQHAKCNRTRSRSGPVATAPTSRSSAEMRSLAADRHSSSTNCEQLKTGFNAFTSRELFETTLDLEYLIDGILVRGQPGGLFGSKKCLKTTIAIDLALSLSIGDRFLNTFPVNRAVRVGVMSGESGAATIRETAVRQAASKGRQLSEYKDVIWSFELPTLGRRGQIAQLQRFVEKFHLEVLIIDPAYMAMPIGDSANNLFSVGALLKELSDLGQRTGCTFLLCHHLRKGKCDQFAVPELEDIAWAGFQEWVRQWLLLGRRERYRPESGGEHKLWLNVGGSAGHSGLWAMDVQEGTKQDARGRRWVVHVTSAAEARSADRLAKQVRKSDIRAANSAAKNAADRTAVLKALRSKPTGESKSALRAIVGMKSAYFQRVIEGLIRDALIESCYVEKSNGRGKRQVPALQLSPQRKG